MSRKTLEDAVAVHKRFYSQSEWGAFMNGARVGYGQGKAEVDLLEIRRGPQALHHVARNPADVEILLASLVRPVDHHRMVQ